MWQGRFGDGMTLCVDLCRVGAGAGYATKEEKWILKNMNPVYSPKIPQMSPGAAHRIQTDKLRKS